MPVVGGLWPTAQAETISGPGSRAGLLFWARKYPAIRSIEGPGDTKEADSGPGRNTTERGRGRSRNLKPGGGRSSECTKAGRQSLADIQGA